MDGKTKYYANFSGDEINGKFYSLGEPIADDVDAGTIGFLAQTGRITATPPDTEGLSTWNVPDDKPLADMNRTELENAARNSVDLSHYTDDELRDGIEQRRAQAVEREGDASTSEPSSDTGDALTGGESEVSEGGDLAPLLAGSVEDLKSRLAGIDDTAQLTSLRELEVAGGNRTTALAAIDARIAALRPAD